MAGTEKGLVKTRLPMAKREQVKYQLLKGLVAEGGPFAGFVEDKRVFKVLAGQISAYFEGSYVDFHKDIHIILGDSLTAFQRRVLEACRDITYGQRISYGKLAEKAGFAGAGRAVGNVMANNHWPLIIPCHRVSCADGKIGGFSAIGGIRLKKRMLKLEEKGFKGGGMG